MGKHYQEGSFLVSESWYRTDRFEIVDDFPCGYQVWNIGRSNFPFPGYLPLGVFENYHMKDVAYYPLKAIKIDEALSDKVLKYATRTKSVTWKNYKEVLNELKEEL